MNELKKVKRGNGKFYRMTFKQPWKKFADWAKENWSDVSNTEPTEDDIKRTAYRKIIRLDDDDSGFNVLADYFRPFQDSDIQAEYKDLLPNQDNPEEVEYQLTIKIIPEIMNTDEEQTKENERFLLAVEKLEAELPALGFTW